MKLTTLLLSLALVWNVSSAQNKQAPKESKTTTQTTTTKSTKTDKDGNAVYVCDSKTSTAYHTDKKCSGLAKCTSTVKQMTKKEAEKAGKKPCKMCM